MREIGFGLYKGFFFFNVSIIVILNDSKASFWAQGAGTEFNRSAGRRIPLISQNKKGSVVLAPAILTGKGSAGSASHPGGSTQAWEREPNFFWPIKKMFCNDAKKFRDIQGRFPGQF